MGRVYPPRPAGTGRVSRARTRNEAGRIGDVLDGGVAAGVGRGWPLAGARRVDVALAGL